MVLIDDLDSRKIYYIRWASDVSSTVAKLMKVPLPSRARVRLSLTVPSKREGLVAEKHCLKVAELRNSVD
jgi:hypothetical protein